MTVDHAVRRKEPLSLAWPLELLHLPFSPSASARANSQHDHLSISRPNRIEGLPGATVV
jgi:hypothetical protein